MYLGQLLIILSLTLSCVQTDSTEKAAKNNNDIPTGGNTGGSSDGIIQEDPLASYAWHLNNTGQSAFSLSSGVSGKDIRLKAVHQGLNILGRNVRIAVSDTGTEIAHSDLAANALGASEHRNYTYTNSSAWTGSNPTPTDNEAHGTGVTGLISAVGWNGIGSRGVAPSSKFAAFRYLYAPSASDNKASRLAKKIDQLGGNFDIFNFSYGFSDTGFYQEDDLVLEALKSGITHGRNGKGSIYVQAAGNGYYGEYYICDPSDPDCIITTFGNTNAHSDLATPYKIVVAATAAHGLAASYSTPGSSIWISAPGGEDGETEPAMITTDLSGCTNGYSYKFMGRKSEFDFGYHSLNKQCDYTSRFNGTSSAAPVITGVVALMLEANPNLTWREVKHILAMTADIDDFDPIYNTLQHPLNTVPDGYIYDELWTTNKAGVLFSNWYGFGRVNAERAVLAAKSFSNGSLGKFEQTSLPDGSWIYDSGTLYGKKIPDESPAPLEQSLWVGHNYIIEAVQIKITTTHPAPGELAIHLVSPSGTESRLLTINNNLEGDSLPEDTIMLSNAFYGERSEGYWTLKIYDGSQAKGTGDLVNWKIQISGRRLSWEANNPSPPTHLALSSTLSNSLSTTPYFSFTNSLNHNSLMYYEAAVGENPDDENIKTWTSIGLENFGHRFNGLGLNQGQIYYLKVRARSYQGVSSVQVIPFAAGNSP